MCVNSYNYYLCIINHVIFITSNKFWHSNQNVPTYISNSVNKKVISEKEREKKLMIFKTTYHLISEISGKRAIGMHHTMLVKRC